MKEKLARFWSYKLIQIKQLFHHRSRTAILIASLTFSFTLLLIFVSSSVNFGKYVYWSAKSDSEFSVYRSDNTKIEGDEETLFTDEQFYDAMTKTEKQSQIENAVFFTRT